MKKGILVLILMTTIEFSYAKTPEESFDFSDDDISTLIQLDGLYDYCDELNWNNSSTPYSFSGVIWEYNAVNLTMHVAGFDLSIVKIPQSVLSESFSRTLNFGKSTQINCNSKVLEISYTEDRTIIAPTNIKTMQLFRLNGIIIATSKENTIKVEQSGVYILKATDQYGSTTSQKIILQ